MSKKFILVLLILCFLMLIGIYSGGKIEEARGESTFYSVNYSSLAKRSDKLTFYYTGESVVLSESSDIDRIIELFDAKMVFKEEALGVTSRYYYSNKLPIYKYVNGKRVNLHINQSDVITVGYPIIYGSY